MALRSDMSLRPRALITGIKGFTGRYLAQDLAVTGYDVFGTAHGTETQSENLFAVDLCDKQHLQQVLREVQPDVVAHLAAISSVTHGNVDEIYRVNIVGTRNLLEGLSGLEKKPRAVLLASSANIYGNTRTEVIAETELALPANDYAISKLAMEHVARLWMDKLPIIVTRPFNYTGVGQTENFLLPKIINHYRRRASDIELGNLDIARDFSDVRTVSKAYARLLELAPAGQTFNVCSGVAHSLRDILNMASELAGYEIKVHVNPAFVRANDVHKLMGDNRRLHECIGELPFIPLRETLAWMLQQEQAA